MIEEKPKIKKLNLNPFDLDQATNGAGVAQNEMYDLLCSLNLGYLFPSKPKVKVNTLFTSLTKMKVTLNNLRVDDLKKLCN